MIEVVEIISKTITHCADNALAASLAQTEVARLATWTGLMTDTCICLGLVAVVLCCIRGIAWLCKWANE